MVVAHAGEPQRLGSLYALRKLPGAPSRAGELAVIKSSGVCIAVRVCVCTCTVPAV